MLMKDLSLLITTISVLNSLSHATNCDPEFFVRSEKAAVDTCGTLYQEFEATFLEPQNLYRLRHVMFPNGRAQPLVVTLSYLIIFKNLSQENLCAGANNNSLLTLDEYKRDVTWTSSSTLSIIDPKDFDFLLPSVLTLLSPIVREYDEVYNPNHVALVLNVGTLTCTPSEEQVNDVIEDLSTKAKAYAANTDPEMKLDSWNTAFEGYSIDEHSHFEFLFVFGPALAATILLLTCLATVSYKEIYHKRLKQKIKHKERPFFQLYRSLTVIVGAVNVLYYSSEIAGFALLLHYQKKISDQMEKEDNDQRIAIYCRFFGLVSSLLFGVFVAYTIMIWARLFEVTGEPSVCCFAKMGNSFCYVTRAEKDADFDSIKDEVSQHLCCVFSCLKISRQCDKNSFINWFVIFNYLAFLIILAWCVVPMITLMFIDPVLTLAVVSFVFVFFILITLLLASLIIVREKKAQHRRTKCHMFWCAHRSDVREIGGNFCFRMCSYTLFWDGCFVGLVSTILFLFATGVLLIIYVMITSNSTMTSGGGIIGFVVAFIPTIITAVAVWLGKRALFPSKGTQGKKQDVQAATSGTGNEEAPDSTGTQFGSGGNEETDSGGVTRNGRINLQPVRSSGGASGSDYEMSCNVNVAGDNWSSRRPQY